MKIYYHFRMACFSFHSLKLFSLKYSAHLCLQIFSILPMSALNTNFVSIILCHLDKKKSLKLSAVNNSGCTKIEIASIYSKMKNNFDIVCSLIIHMVYVMCGKMENKKAEQTTHQLQERNEHPRTLSISPPWNLQNLIISWFSNFIDPRESSK